MSDIFQDVVHGRLPLFVGGNNALRMQQAVRSKTEVRGCTGTVSSLTQPHNAGKEPKDCTLLPAPSLG